MLRSYFLVFFVSCVVLSEVLTLNIQPLDEKHPDCGPNEVLNLCVGCPPEDSCYDRNQIACPAAFLGCSPGCVCKEGFIRKTLGSECIPKEKCGSPCMIFEHYTECKECSNATCSSITNPAKSDCESKESCTPGCTCWDGYYRADENSPCLHRCFCPELENTPYCVDLRTPLDG